MVDRFKDAMRNRILRNLLYGDAAKFLRWLMILVAAGVTANVVLVLLTTDRAHLPALSEMSRAPLALAVLLTLIPWFTNAARTRLWARFLHVDLSFRDAWRIVLATEMGSAVTPTAGGGGYVKLGMLARRGLPVGSAASLMVLGTVENGIFFAIALPIAITASGAWDLPAVERAFVVLRTTMTESTAVTAPVALAVVLLGLVIVRWHQGRAVTGIIGRNLDRVRHGWGDFTNVFKLIALRGKLRLLCALGLASIGWVARYTVISALLLGLGLDVQPVKFAVLQWVVFTIVSFVPTPGGAGAAEVAFFIVYAPFVDNALLGISTAAWRFLTYYFLLALGGVIFIILSTLPRMSGARRLMVEDPDVTGHVRKSGHATPGQESLAYLDR